MEILMTLTTILTAASVILLFALLFVYFRNLKRVKSKLLIGLIIFSFVFLLQNVFSLYYSLTMMQYYVPEIQVHVFVFSLLQAIAFAVMLWITWE